jgi:hypothetical protein
MLWRTVGRCAKTLCTCTGRLCQRSKLPAGESLTRVFLPAALQARLISRFHDLYLEPALRKLYPQVGLFFPWGRER